MALELRYRCDGVGCNSLTYNPFKDRWNILTRANPHRDESTFHFCTVRCLLKFFEYEDWVA